MDAYTTITIFGGAGFLGRNLVCELARTGAVLRVATRRPRQAEFLRPAGRVGQIVPLWADIRDENSAAAAIAGADIVINLVGALDASQKTYEALHVEGAARLARLARQAGATQFVQISTLGADAQENLPYLASKGRGETAVSAAFPGAHIIRPAVMFGPEDAFFNKFARLATKSPVMPLIGGGGTAMQPVFVCDVAQTIATALTQPPGRPDPLQLGGPRIYTLRQLLELLLAELGRTRPFLPLPWPLAGILAALAGPLPGAPLSRAQLGLLRRDNVVPADAIGFEALGIRPHSVEVVLPTYMDTWRAGGRFARQRRLDRSRTGTG